MTNTKDNFKRKVVSGMATTVVAVGALNPLATVFADEKAVEEHKVPTTESIQKDLMALEETQQEIVEEKVEEVVEEKAVEPRVYNNEHERLMAEDEAYASIDAAFEEGAEHSGDLSVTPQTTSATRASDKLGYNWNLSNGVPVIKNFITNRNNYNTTANSQKYIVIHDTANTSKGADAETHARYYQNNDRKVSANYTVDKDSVQYNVSASHSAHHCGDGGGRYGITNSNSIGIEMCINSDGDYNKTYNNTLLLVKKLMSTYGIPASRVVMHKDASGKNCSAALISGRYGKTWSQFKAAIGGSTSSSVTETAIHRLGEVYGVPSGDTLNIRTEPNASSSLVRTVTNGTRLELIAKCSNGWYKIKLSDGKIGYASGSYIKDIGAYPVYSGPKVGSSNLNMRQTPDTSATLITTLPAGTHITTVHGKEKNPDGYWWLKVTALGKTGWVHSSYVENVDLNKVPDLSVKKPSATEALNIRETPDWQGKVLGTIPAGKEFTSVINRTSNGWVKVSYGGHTGYVHGNYISNLNLNSLPLVDPVEKKPTMTIDTYLRATPDWSAEQLELLKTGNNVTVLGKYDTWAKVKSPSGKEGWVAQKYVENVDWNKVSNLEKPAEQKLNAFVTEPVNLRQEAKWTTSYLGVINTNERVAVQSSGHIGEWKKVYVPRLNKTGFVHEQYLVEDGAVKQGTVNASVNLREEKDWTSKYLGVINSGTKVDVLDTSDGYWIKVKAPSLGNKIGYIASTYINM